MSNEDISRYESDELTKEELAKLIANKDSFIVVGVQNLSEIVHKVETAIEKKGLKCRVYTEYRSTAIGGLAIPTGVTQLTGLATMIGVGIHNLATFNPDYEIGKNKINKTLTVTYKKIV